MVMERARQQNDSLADGNWCQPSRAFEQPWVLGREEQRALPA